MKIGTVSDLHWESEAIVPLEHTDFDVLVVAGDVLAGHHEGNVIEQLANCAGGKPVVFVPGNHEFEGRSVRETIAKLKSDAYNYKNIHVSYNDSVEIDGVRFLGTTLWTNMQLYGKDTVDFHIKTALQYLPDFRHQRVDGSVLTMEEVLTEFQHCLSFLKTHLAQHHEKTVVVTHFAPNKQSLHSKYRNSPLNPWFVNNLPPELFNGVSLWIHGHTHTQFDYMVGTCRVVCNPSGFHQEITLKGQLDIARREFIRLFPILKTQESVMVPENSQFKNPLTIQV